MLKISCSIKKSTCENFDYNLELHTGANNSVFICMVKT